MFDPTGPSVLAARRREAEAAARLRAVGILELAGRLLDPPRRSDCKGSSWTTSSGCSPRTRPVLDVREKDERDEGYIAGSRNIPYRLVRAWADDLRAAQPLVTICSSGSRARSPPACSPRRASRRGP